MKKIWYYIICLGLGGATLSFGSPADRVVNNNNYKTKTVSVKNTTIKNKSDIKGVIFENIGIEQQNIVHSIKIRKETVIKNTTIHNKAHMTGTRSTNLGREQVNVFGGVDISDTETKKK